MPKDFSSKQIRVSQLIGSGSVSGTHASIVFYSASHSSNFQGGTTDSSMFKNVGRDVFLFISGAARDQVSERGVSLFGGDVVISGTLYTDRFVAEVDATTTGSISLSGSLHVSQSATFGGSLSIQGNRYDDAVSGSALEVDGGVRLGTSGSAQLFVNGDGIYLTGSVSDFKLTGSIRGTEFKVTSDASHIDSNLYLSGTVSDYSLSGTIKSSVSKVIESSVATEIETSAGLLTLDGKSGISLQSNGSPYISIDSTGNTTFLGPLYVSGAVGKDGSNIHLSGTVSDFSLTGTIKNSSSKVIESSAATKIETTAGELTLDANSGIKIQTSGSDILTTSAAGIYLSGTVSDYSLSGTIKTSASKIIEASAGAEIETAAGFLTLDGKSGVRLQTGGADILRTGNDSIYLSGTVSDFSLTGTIKNSSSKVIESSIATEIETSAGSLTLDGFSGVDVQISGSSYITVNTGAIVIGAGRDPGVIPPALYVSGAIQSNLHVSGALFANNISGSLTSLANGSEYIVAGSGVSVSTGSTGQLTISASGVESFKTISISGQSDVVAEQTGDTLTLVAGNNTVITTDASTDTITIQALQGGGSSTVFNDRNHKATSTGSLSLAGPGLGLIYDTTDVGSDVFFFVSGTIGTRGTTNTGSAVFGGDTLTSGSIFALSGFSGSLTTLSDGTDYLIAGAGISIATGSGGALTITNDGTVGDITGVTAGTGLSGGGTSGDVTLNIDDSTVATVSGTAFTGDISRGNTTIGTNTITNTGATFTLDASGDIIIDADGGQIYYKDGASYFMECAQGANGNGSGAAGDWTYSLGTQNKAMIWLANDAGEYREALRIQGSTGVNAVVVNEGALSDVDFRVETQGEDQAFQVDASANTIYINRGETDVTSSFHSDSDVALTIAGGGVVINEDGNSGVDFRVESNNLASAIFVDAGTDQVAIGAHQTSAALISSGGIGSDVNLFVTGVIGSQGGTTKGTVVLGGDAVVSGTLRVGPTGSSAGTISTAAIFHGDVLPGLHNSYDLGSNSTRWANIYTADLHLKNDRGDWTIVEEEDMLTVVNNLTGKRYKMMLEEIKD
tara:strand:+ start:4628 stop:7846 length:3219 start_codon:yes stop_codon:yes gene_type:complete